MSSSGISNSSESKRNELEVSRLEAEVSKLKAEEEEIRLRTKEAIRLQQLPWYKQRSFLQIIQIIVTTLGGIALLGFYINYVVEPARNIKVLELKNESLELKLKNLSEQENLVNQRKKLQEDNASLTADLSALRKKYGDLSAKYEQLGKEKEARQASMAAQTIQSNINEINSRSQPERKKTSSTFMCLQSL